MQNKTISPQQFNTLPRNIRRVLDRQAKKEGRELPDKIPEKVKVYTLVDKITWTKALKILEGNQIPFENFMQSALEQLIIAERKAKNSKLR